MIGYGDKSKVVLFTKYTDRHITESVVKKFEKTFQETGTFPSYTDRQMHFFKC